MSFLLLNFVLIKQTKHPCFIKSLGSLRQPFLVVFQMFTAFQTVWKIRMWHEWTVYSPPRPCKFDLGATTERLLVPTPNAHPSMSNLNQRKLREKLEEQERKRREEEEQRKKKDGGLDRLLHSLLLDITKGITPAVYERSCLCIFPGIYQEVDI